MSARPLCDAEVVACFTLFQDASHILVALSGGPDSVALLAMLAGWARGRPLALTAATVDHGLRPQSAAEAEAAGALAARLGIAHQVLPWIGEKPVAGLQEAARAARYRILSTFGAAVGASHLATAHTLDDQAETVLMRLAAGSGLAGLAAMSAATRRGGLVHARPLLGIAKARLVATCEARGLPFVVDPSNADPRFSRSRWRALSSQLAGEGLTGERLARLAMRAERAEEALRHEAAALLRRCPVRGEARDLAALADAPFEIALRALAGLLPPLGGDGHPLRLERLERLVAEMRDALRARRLLRRTLGGRVINLRSDGFVTLAPEPPRRRGLGGAKMPQAPGKDIVHLAEAFPLATAPCVHTLGDTCDHAGLPVAGRDR